MFNFLTKEYWKKKLNDKSGMCFVIPVMSENELEDGKKYICFRKELTKYGSYIWREKFVNLTWCKKENIFIELLAGDFKTYRYGEVYPVSISIGYNPNSYFLNYDPKKINAFDLKELSDICFNLSDENTQSDEIWDKLITYFDERGIK